MMLRSNNLTHIIKDCLLLACYNILYEDKSSFKNVILNKIFTIIYKSVALPKNDKSYYDNCLYLTTNEKITVDNLNYFFVAKRWKHHCNRDIIDDKLTEIKPYYYHNWYIDHMNRPYICVDKKLKDLKESAKTWADLAKKHGSESCWCKERQFKSNYKEIARYKENELNNFIKKYQTFL